MRARLALVILALAGVPAAAGESLVGQLLREVDANGDGLVTPEETEAWIARTREAKRAEAKDAWDGLLAFTGKPAGTTELAAGEYGHAVSGMLDAADADKDGAVTAKERDAYLSGIADPTRRRIVAELMGNIDADGDGTVSAAERKAVEGTLAGAPAMRLSDISEAAAKAPEAERSMFKVMVQMKGDAEGRIRIKDFVAE